MIEIKGISKKFDNDNVLEKLNCSINDNCIYGLVGSNGSGKSTLLRIINGIYNQDKGKILIDGKTIEEDPEIKQRMVFVPDDLFFFSGYNLTQMAEFYQALYHNFDMTYLLKMAEVLKLNLDKDIGDFSKGMKRQCALICALATNAEYIFFDETFDGLDPVVRNLVKRLIAKQMEDKKTTIILTSHNLRELEDICENLGLLHKGGILFESEIDSIKTSMFKVQISFKEDFSKDKFKKLDILSFKKSGSVATMIIKEKSEKARKELEKMKPLILDFLPLTLEEVFIYEMEALGYEFNEIV